MDILYSESKVNMNWNEVLREIKSDLHSFVNEGGWSFLQDDLSEEESAEEKISNPEDSEFKASEMVVFFVFIVFLGFCNVFLELGLGLLCFFN